MYYCARTQMLSDYPLSKSLKMVKEMGYDGVELSVLNKNFYINPELLEDYAINHINSLISSLDLKVSAISCHGDYTYNDDRFELIKKTISIINSYNTKTLIISGERKRLDLASNWNDMIVRTKEIVKLATSYDVNIAIEFEPGFIVGNTNELLKLFDEIPSDHLYANLDIGHAFLCDENPIESIKILNDKIAHVHIENMQRGVHNHLPPHIGDMNLKEYVKALNDIGFKGGASLDLYSGNYEEAASLALPFLKSL